MRAFHLGERAKELDATAEAYWKACEARAAGRAGKSEVVMASRRCLAAARAFGRAKANHAMRNASPAAGLVTFCPGCNKPLPQPGLGRPKKYHSTDCYNLARRLHR